MPRREDFENLRESRMERPVRQESAATKTPSAPAPKPPDASPRSKQPSIDPVQGKPTDRGIIPPARRVPSPPPGRAGEEGRQRTRQGDIQRPVAGGQIPQSVQDGGARPNTSPATTKPIPNSPTVDGRAKPAPGSVDTGVVQATPGPPTVDGRARTVEQLPVTDPGVDAAQGLPGDPQPLNAAGAPQTALEQQSELVQQVQPEIGDTSGILSGMRAQEEQELMRQSQPSPVKGVPTGTYERVVKDDYSKDIEIGRPLSQRQNAGLRAHAEAQLKDFGDYPGKGDPNSPPPPIRPGGRSFNPFKGSFTGEDGPNAFKLMGIDFDKLKLEFFQTGGNGQPAPTLGPPPPPTQLK